MRLDCSHKRFKRTFIKTAVYYFPGRMFVYVCVCVFPPKIIILRNENHTNTHNVANSVFHSGSALQPCLFVLVVFGFVFVFLQ